MNCHDLPVWSPDFHAGLLTDEQAAQFRSHLDACAACSQTDHQYAEGLERLIPWPIDTPARSAQNSAKRPKTGVQGATLPGGVWGGASRNLALPNQNPDTPSVPEEAQLPSATPSLPSSDADFLQSLLRRIEAQSPAPEIQPPPSAQTPSLVSLASIRRSRLAPWALAASLLLFLTGLWRIDRNPQTPSDDLASWAVLAEADPGTAWADLEDLDDSLATELDTAQELEAAAEPDLFAGAEASTEGFEEGLWADLGDQEIAGWGPDESLLEELEQLPPADREHLIQFFEHS